MRDQDPGAQLYLHDATHDPVGRRDIEINDRHVIAVVEGWSRASSRRVNIGRVSHEDTPKLSGFLRR